MYSRKQFDADVKKLFGIMNDTYYQLFHSYSEGAE